VAQELTAFPDGPCIVATGPLTSDGLIPAIEAVCPGDEFLHFYDAAAPLVAFESIDMENAWFGSRYNKGTADYINCPMNKEQYEAFVRELASAQEAAVHGFEDGGVFEGCMPVEVMARRGQDTLRYGPLKPVGLRNPETDEAYYAVVQLRRDNEEGTVYNLVGFQTHLTFPEQRRVFGMIPALKNAEYLRYGKMHRNTFINSPHMLNRYYQLRADERLAFAGQMTGVEGYVESCASGMLAALEMARRLKGLEPLNFPRTTAIGALGLYIENGAVSGDFQPMNVNFGIIEPLGERIRNKREKNLKIAQRSLAVIDELIGREDFNQ
jgi:methylenetetrahydrofolate--tRNA-(uracil-5-)-methyltransferase